MSQISGARAHWVRLLHCGMYDPLLCVPNCYWLPFAAKELIATSRLNNLLCDWWQVTRESVQHLPNEEGWASLMEPLHDSLATSQVSTDRLPQLHQVQLSLQAAAPQGGCQAHYTPHP